MQSSGSSRFWGEKSQHAQPHSKSKSSQFIRFQKNTIFIIIHQYSLFLVAPSSFVGGNGWNKHTSGKNLGKFITSKIRASHSPWIFLQYLFGISIPLMRENQGTHLPLSHLLRHTTPPRYSQCLRVRAAPSDARRSKIAMAFLIVGWSLDGCGMCRI